MVSILLIYNKISNVLVLKLRVIYIANFPNYVNYKQYLMQFIRENLSKIFHIYEVKNEIC